MEKICNQTIKLWFFFSTNLLPDFSFVRDSYNGIKCYKKLKLIIYLNFLNVQQVTMSKSNTSVDSRFLTKRKYPSIYSTINTSCNITCIISRVVKFLGFFVDHSTDWIYFLQLPTTYFNYFTLIEQIVGKRAHISISLTTLDFI